MLLCVMLCHTFCAPLFKILAVFKRQPGGDKCGLQAR